MLSLGKNGKTSLRLVRNVRRNVIIPARRDAKSRRRRVQPVIDSNDVLDLDTIDFRKEKDVQFKVNQLKEFTRNLRDQIKHTDELRRKHDIEEEVTQGASSDVNDFDTDAGMILGAFNDNMTTSRTENNLSALLLSGKANKPLLPDRLSERIENKDLILRCLFDKRNTDFNPIINELYHSEQRLKGLGIKYIYSNILFNKFDKLSFKSLSQLDEMIMESVDNDATRLNCDIYERLMLSLSRVQTRTAQGKLEVCGKLRELLERMDITMSKKSFQPTQHMLNACVFTAAKAMNWENMDYFLKKFTTEYAIQPNKKTYTTVISFYNNLGHYKKAWQLFDSLKFLSLEHKPDTKVYNLMLEVCQKERDYARTLDLFQEMDDLEVEKDLKTYINAAKSLAISSADNIVSEGKSDSIRLMSWKYIHKIHEDPILSGQLTGNPRNNLLLLETMMVLSAYDGDVGICRALYYKYTNALFKIHFNEFKKYNMDNVPVDFVGIWKRALSAQMFNWLLLSYSKFKRSRLPLLLGYPEGSTLRRSIIYSVDYLGHGSSYEKSDIQLPMLPMLDLNDPGLIMNESKALWRFNLEYGGNVDIRELPNGMQTVTDIENLIKSQRDVNEFKIEISNRLMDWKANYVNHKILNMKSLITFLTIPIRLHEPQEFKLRLQEFTFQAFEFNDIVESQFAKLKSNQLQLPVVTTDATALVTDMITPPEFLLYLVSMKHKLATNCAIYEICMKAAIAFHDFELAKKTWKDRGKFRLTDSFQKLKPAERQQSDATFAQLMVEYFANEKMYQDALSIIFSSLKTVNWEYRMVKSLHKALLAIEDENSAARLLSVVNRKSKMVELEEEIKSLGI
ncbi:unnamed protein product [Kluyveromyces dobzhanskii CBS 2104]|uniref:Mitochondrial 15S rRNA processing factor CCM1 n=1 Tax=Kluyveromyces dobzhanskii CBS 2104 TaxID=1427455 RepID=A0A0A8L8X0_9SACH|nr:unnamed protein product [Kluyveromyces dobzhanskii CBS 2104]